MKVKELLEAKEEEHGRVNDVADAVCGMWDIFYRSRNYATMSRVERMCVHMIMMKLARAMSGGRLKDHWVDMAGYAHLVVNEIEAHEEDQPAGFGKQGI